LCRIGLPYFARQARDSAAGDRVDRAGWDEIAALPWIVTPTISTHSAMANQMFDAHGVAPAKRIEAAGGRADEWRFLADLPPLLRLLDKAAGLNHSELTVRSLYCPGVAG